MRLGVYTDYVYRQSGGVIYAERAFAVFLSALADKVERLILIGRLATDENDAHYALPDTLELAPLRYYRSLANPLSVLRALVGSLRQLWRALDEVDVLWALGPYPHAIMLVLMAAVRRKTVVLGVRQDWPLYVRMRHPARRGFHLAADLLEWLWRALARSFPVAVVGSQLAERYSHSRAVLNFVVSLIPADAVLDQAPARGDDALQVLSVGRLDQEKNPLMLADVLSMLCARDPRWRLVICGEGKLAAQLQERLERLGVAEQATIVGYVPMGDALMELYRSSLAMLHVSFTEGFPQVLVEAFANGLPVVATAVGGVPEGVGDSALLVPPGDPQAPADALTRLAEDPELRAQLTASGLSRAHELTLEAQRDRLATFLADAREATLVRRRS